MFFVQKMTTFLVIDRHHSHPLRFPSDRFSSTLCRPKTQPTFFHFHQDVTPWITRGDSLPSPSDATVCMTSCLVVASWIVTVYVLCVFCMLYLPEIK